MDESALTAGLVGLVMASFKLVEKLISKANGGGVEIKIAQLDEDLGEIKQRLSSLATGFYEFREETRIRWAKMEAKDGE